VYTIEAINYLSSLYGVHLQPWQNCESARIGDRPVRGSGRYCQLRLCCQRVANQACPCCVHCTKVGLCWVDLSAISLNNFQRSIVVGLPFFAATVHRYIRHGVWLLSIALSSIAVMWTCTYTIRFELQRNEGEYKHTDHLPGLGPTWYCGKCKKMCRLMW
jgi:hypothetical protein